jgi:hypothetical protein
MEHRGAETGKLGKRMRYLELETTYSEIVVLTRSTNVGTSDWVGTWNGARGGAADSRV